MRKCQFLTTVLWSVMTSTLHQNNMWQSTFNYPYCLYNNIISTYQTLKCISFQLPKFVFQAREILLNVSTETCPFQSRKLLVIFSIINNACALIRFSFKLIRILKNQFKFEHNQLEINFIVYIIKTNLLLPWIQMFKLIWIQFVINASQSLASNLTFFYLISNLNSRC